MQNITLNFHTLSFIFLGCKKRCKSRNCLIYTLCGGERGIRTPGASQLNGFQDRRNRPLCHLSLLSGGKSSPRKSVANIYGVFVLCKKCAIILSFFLSSGTPVCFLNAISLLSCFIYYFDGRTHKWNGIKKKSGKCFSGLFGFFLSAINGYSDSVRANYGWGARYPSG